MVPSRQLMLLFQLYFARLPLGWHGAANAAYVLTCRYATQMPEILRRHDAALCQQLLLDTSGCCMAVILYEAKRCLQKF